MPVPESLVRLIKVSVAGSYQGLDGVLVFKSSQGSQRRAGQAVQMKRFVANPQLARPIHVFGEVVPGIKARKIGLGRVSK